MAASLYSNCTASGLHSRTSPPQPSLSCRSRVFIGLRPLSSYPATCVKPSSNFQFFEQVHKSVRSRNRKGNSTRGQVTMTPFGTPQVPYRNPGEGTWHWLDLWNALYRERIVFLGSYIDDEVSNQVLATMLYLDSVSSDNQKLILYICCPGGDIAPGMALYDTLLSLRSPLSTHNGAYAYNLAAYILSAGDKGKRSSVRGARVMIQPVAGAARGQADDMENEASELLKIRNFFYKEFAKNTGQPLEKVQADLNRTKRFNPQQALEYGIIDHIIKPFDVKKRGQNKEGSITGT